jgi:hypothetical protein
VKRVLAVAALLFVLVAPPAHAQADPSAVLGLASQTAFVRGDAVFRLRLDLDRVRAPDRLELVVTLHRAVTSRSQFAETLDGALLGTTVHRDRIPFDELTFDAGGAVPITISEAPTRPGVYPVSVRLLDTDDDSEVAALYTHLIRVPDDPVELPLSVAWVQPYGADPALQPDGTVALDDSQLDELRTIASQLDDGVPLTIVPTPETIAALAAIDDGTTTDALARLLADDQVLSTPFVDVDVNAMVRSGRAGDIARQRVAGTQVVHDALGITTDPRTWSLDGAVTPSAMSSLADLGVQRVVLDESAMVQLPSSATGGLTLARPFSIPAGGGTMDAVSVDPSLVDHLTEREPVLAAHHLLADLAVLHFDSPGTSRGVVIRPPAGWHPSEPLLAALFPALAQLPVIRSVTLDQLLASVDALTDEDDAPVVRELVSTSPSSLGVSSSDLDRARDQITGYGSLTSSSNPDLARLERLVLVAESSDLTAAARRTYLDAVLAEISTRTSKVRVLGDRTYRLTAREGSIPLTLVNDNPFEVTVSLELTSDKLEFAKSDDLGHRRLDGLVLAPSSTTTEVVPVKARTSGAFPLRVIVLSPDGHLELGRTQITITSTVASGVGIVLSGGAALFLVLWWASHWRSARRTRRAAAVS